MCRFLWLHVILGVFWVFFTKCSPEAHVGNLLLGLVHTEFMLTAGSVMVLFNRFPLLLLHSQPKGNGWGAWHQQRPHLHPYSKVYYKRNEGLFELQGVKGFIHTVQPCSWLRDLFIFWHPYSTSETGLTFFYSRKNITAHHKYNV